MSDEPKVPRPERINANNASSVPGAWWWRGRPDPASWDDMLLLTVFVWAGEWRAVNFGKLAKSLPPTSPADRALFALAGGENVRFALHTRYVRSGNHGYFTTSLQSEDYQCQVWPCFKGPTPERALTAAGARRLHLRSVRSFLDKGRFDGQG